ncbi:MAG: tRNA preQ1(34) S-adenosylmethionine ribosyltransferase-isomerase QueA [Candidatus Hydrothermia bacterium]
MLSLELFDYDLPSELIAQEPLKERDQAKMLVLNKKDDKIIHSHFYELPHFLKPGDLVIINKTRVIKARLVAKAEDTGGKLEIFFLESISRNIFKAMVHSRKKARVGRTFIVGEECRLAIKDFEEYMGADAKAIVEILSEISVFDLLEKYGQVPLPHYIRRAPKEEDIDYYQTIFAEKGPSVAAPTAGLHFTETVIKNLKEKGVSVEPIYLHVGLGTFKPVKTQDIISHRMDAEYYEIPEETAKKIIKTREQGNWVVACGTTSVRTLESWKFDKSKLSGCTDLFIYPGFRFDVIDGLITNFHMPKSTPLILVCAFAGREKILNAYKEAIQMNYGFLSYGDAMLILPEIDNSSA